MVVRARVLVAWPRAFTALVGALLPLKIYGGLQAYGHSLHPDLTG